MFSLLTGCFFYFMFSLYLFWHICPQRICNIYANSLRFLCDQHYMYAIKWYRHSTVYIRVQ